MSTIADLPSTSFILTSKGNALSGSVNDGVIEETHAWYCPWNFSSQFFQAVIGTNQTIPLGNGLTITRKVPLRNPFNPNLFATGMSYDCVDGARKGNNPYQHVIFKVKFSNKLGGATDGFDSQGNQTPDNKVPLFCSISRKGAGKNITDTARQYTYNNGIKAKHDIGVYFAGGTYQIKLQQIPDIDAWQGVVAPLENTINSQPFNLGAFTRAPGSILFESYDYDEDFDVLGNRTWTGIINLNCSSLPWNNIFVGGQQYLLTPKPYPNSADHNILYQ